MEFRSRHVQPFTFEQATLLDVPVITAEIARLQNSLVHLRDTQRQLKQSIDAEDQPDPVILQALEENNVVISSQEERVSMLRLALEHKGLVSHDNPHYDPTGASDPHLARSVEEPTGSPGANFDPNADEGVFL